MGTERDDAAVGTGGGMHGHRLPRDAVAGAGTVALVVMKSGWRRRPHSARPYSVGMGVSTKTGISRVVFAW